MFNHERETPRNSSGSNDIRVVLADDHQLFRQGLKALLELERGITIVGEDDADVIGATTRRLTFVVEHGGFVLCQAVRLACRGRPGGRFGAVVLWRFPVNCRIAVRGK